jgi:FkbM family methyltransferase
VDAGAFIGDHTVAYSKAVGEHGMVHAFEPNPLAFQCLVHNVSEDVICHKNALGDTEAMVPISGNNGNHGGAYIGEHMKVTDARMLKLDDFKLAPDFMKIDVEGSELKLLKGAEKTIEKHRPIMVIEMNSLALERQGTTPGAVLSWLDAHGYTYSVMQENCGFTDPLFDILCLPAATPPETVSSAPAHTPESQSAPAAPVVPLRELSLPNKIQLLVNELQEIADVSPGNKAIVTSKLVYAGLRPVIPKKPKKLKYESDPFASYKKRTRKRKQSAKKHSPERILGVPPGDQEAGSSA